MNKLLSFLTAFLLSINLLQAQCDLDFSYVNTGTNMTAFFTPPAASSIHSQLGDGTIGSFYVDADGSFICAASTTFNGSQIQLAVMADDSTSPDKDGFLSGESINWFYETNDGSVYLISPSPNDNFTINGISFIQSASITEVDCGGGDDTSDADQCPALDFDFVNTGSNMTLFITPPGASALSSIGNGTIGVYYIDNDGQQLCGGASVFSGSQVQITAMADDSTSPEKDGFASGESIVWKFEDTEGNQFNLTPTPQDVFALNGISFVSGISYDAISCAVDVEGCTNENYIEYNPNASIDDGSCNILIVEGCTDEFADNYNPNANLDDGSCFTSIPGCTDASACNYDVNANQDDNSCDYVSCLDECGVLNGDNSSCLDCAGVPNGTSVDLGCGCGNPASQAGYDCEGNCIVDTDGDGVCDEFEIVGCQDPTAANYDPNATDSPSNGGDLCPSLNFDVLNTGSNMTLFLTDGSLLSELGNGTIGVYFSDGGNLVCGGASAYTGSQVQITAFGDDATTLEKDGFTAGESIVWKFEDTEGNQYNLNPGPNDVYTLNAVSFITSMTYSSISCGGGDDISCEYLGCTNSSYLEYDSGATIDDGSCQTLIVEGCTNSNYVEYNPNANVDDGSCSVISLVGCTDSNSCDYNPNANTDDGSCNDYPEAGYDCEGNCIVDTDGDGVCDEFEIVGCQDPTAANYDPNATDSPSNGGDLCPPLNFDYVNTGSNMTLFVTDGSILSELGNGTIGVYFSDGGNLVCGGASAYTGSQVQIVVFGDDATTLEKDGFTTGESIVWKFEDTEGNQYNLNPGPNDVYALNAISFVTSMTYSSISCGGGDDISCEYLGCTNASYLEYDSGATIDDGSCQTLIVEGCTDSDACNFDPSVNIEDNSCTYPVFGYDCDGNLWEDVYEDCVESGGDDGIGQSDVDAAYLTGYQNGVESVDVTLNDTQVYSDGFNAGVESVIPEDGVTQADLDAAVAVAIASAEEEIDGLNESLSFYIAEASSLDDALASSESALNTANAQISELQAQLDDILANCGDDGITQIDVDAAYLTGYSDGAASIDITSDNLAVADEAYGLGYADGIASVDITSDNQAAFDEGAASVDITSNDDEVYGWGYGDGYTAGTIDGAASVDITSDNEDVAALAYADGAASVDITSDNQAVADESYIYGFNDGVLSAQNDIDALQVLLDEALANSGGGSCEPIYIDLLEGWNIMGYTLPYPQDVAATLSSIVSNVQIVKNNSAAVYWPEYSFNGIGDFIPGQGYQIRMLNALNGYTFPDVGGERIELTPSVPEWVHDLPVLNHPNDIRSLVRVVNMLGQQVDPSTQFKGEVLLYLYNDGTTEKRIVN